MNVKPKAYQGDGFHVTYDKGGCTHTGVCVKTLPSVFNPKGKPWVKLEGASKEAVATMIKSCPSGALKFYNAE